MLVPTADWVLPKIMLLTNKWDLCIIKIQGATDRRFALRLLLKTTTLSAVWVVVSFTSYYCKLLQEEKLWTQLSLKTELILTR